MLNLKQYSRVEWGIKHKNREIQTPDQLGGFDFLISIETNNLFWNPVYDTFKRFLWVGFHYFPICFNTMKTSNQRLF